MSNWTWAAATSAGTSHIRVGRGSDDSAACMTRADKGVLIGAVSDGAGSASMSKRGSSIAVRAFCRQALQHVRSDGCLDDLTDEIVNNWLDNIRDRVSERARSLDKKPRDFAATLVGFVAWPDEMLVMHVGDGACVYRLQGSPQWEVACWPESGEFASTTYFITDDPQPRIQVKRLKRCVEDIAVFSDGLERLALKFDIKTAFPGFFNSMFQPLRVPCKGRNRPLSRELKNFLESYGVNQRTDDDKSLILACRGTTRNE